MSVSQSTKLIHSEDLGRKVFTAGFVSPPFCFFYSIISMNFFGNRKDASFETYDFLWILRILLWAYRFTVDNLCFAWIKEVIGILSLFS